MKATSVAFAKVSEVVGLRQNSCVWSFEASWLYTVVVTDTKQSTLMPIISSKIKPDGIVYTDGYRSDNAFDVSEFKHFRINHSKEFVKDQSHINGIENFWLQAKRVLRKYNDTPKKNFHLFIKECEFRFNYSTPSNQLKILRKWCGI